MIVGTTMQPPLEPYNIVNFGVVAMAEFVREAIDDPQLIQDFMYRNYQTLNSNYVFVFVVRRGEDEWRLYKRLVDFKEFSGALTSLYGKPPSIFLTETNQGNPALFEQMRQFLLACSRDFTIQIPFMTFMEDSRHNYNGLVRYAELFMYKRSKGRHRETLRCQGCCRNWHLRYFLIHSEGVVYKDDENRIREFIPYDLQFIALNGRLETDHDLRIIIESSHRTLTVEAQNSFEYLKFLYALKLGLINSDYAKINRFDSFAPSRVKCHSQFYADGAGYFRDMAAALLEAREEVLILDWWLSPEFYLIRPVTPETERYRFDRIIAVLAARGVTVRIILYQEPRVLTNNSMYTKKTLEKLNPHFIRVIRHPNTVVPFLWSHHEKLMVIDGRIAFMGGLDITYSRYDTCEHPIFDYTGNMFPGIEYANERKQETKDVEHFARQHLNPNIPRMPWHDIGIKLRGEVVWDLTAHFIQYWNFAACMQKLNNAGSRSDSQSFLWRGFSGCRQLIFYGADLFRRMYRKCFPAPDPRKFGRYMEQLAAEDPVMKTEIETERGTKTGRHFWTRNLTKQIAAQDRLLKKQNMIAKDIEKGMDVRFLRILMQLDKRSLTEKERFNQDFIEANRRTKRRRLEYYNPLRMEVRKYKQWSQTEDYTGDMKCQIVRSSCSWSIGATPTNTEFSIQIAYIELIAKSKHFIYIENQFFISSTAHKYMKNQICNAIVERIVLAFEQGQPFKVYIFLPLLPSFAGEIDQRDATVMRLTLHYEHSTIIKSVTSMISQLQAKVGLWQNYIQFFGLRNHGRRTPGSSPATEIIYIHSKLMIVDDAYLICGSANLNDRSMNGDRDSELAVVCNSMNFVQSTRAGIPVGISQPIYEFRAKLWQEHFGITSPQELDPLSEYTWNLTRRISLQNTQIYRSVFGCYPDDNIRHFEEIAVFKGKANPNLYNQLIPSLRGHVVDFPLYFLERENLGAKAGKKEAVAPKITLT